MSADAELPDSHVLAEHAAPVPLTSLSFRIWPIVHERTRVWPMLAGVVAVTVVVGVSTDSLGWALATVTLLALALWRMLVPIYFEINSLGVTQRALGRRWLIPWSAVARCEVHGEGILLLKQDEQSPFSRLGGLYIPWSAYRDDLLELVEQHLSTRGQRGGSTELKQAKSLSQGSETEQET